MLYASIIKKSLVFGGLYLSLHGVFATNSIGPTTEKDQMSRQIFMLEKALAPKSAKNVALVWAEAVKNRNGAVQYMLECPDLQSTSLNHFIELNWVTGVSSPWVASYTITPQQPQKNIWRYVIQYKLAASDVINWSNVDEISVVRISNEVNSSQQWCIKQLKQSSPKNN
ncbi:hypothetical protein [Legionella fallonii]|uniref:Uncharacterized protein n=1 Tax=Legionella fallonii LLAP-10 TaxID=1212491 RepID=A0A098G967_9GAMM|nr:hypothetical protein [Legionella fallonii]CEG59013.1 conserved exported protein of unknown function [Legionella fallonii LLAP-10]